MYLLYSLLFSLWVAVMLPVFAYRALRYGKYLEAVAQRFGRLPESLRADGRKTFWFHSCSVGETLSVQPLVSELHSRFPDARFVFSTITKTGQAVARQRFSQYGPGNCFYFPIDLASVCNHFLTWIDPAIIVTIDTEIWPNLLRQAHRRGVPIIMANGRISPRSSRLYRFVRPMLRKVFSNYTALLMKSEDDARRIRMIGAPADKIVVTGNIKYDKEVVEQGEREQVVRSLGKALGLSSANDRLIVAGSTHEGEEQVLLEVLRRLKEKPNLGETRLLLAPRHPERFDAVAQLASRAGFPVKRRSENHINPSDAQVLLLDTIGELATAYRFSTIAFVGGTLIPHGGQSILEPAWHAKPIVIGPSMENFRQTARDFLERDAVIQIKASAADKEMQVEELTDVFAALLEDEEKRNTLGSAACSVFENNRGAARFTVEKISTVFQETCKAGKIT